MIDFIQIRKPNHNGKVTPFFGHCKMLASYPNGGAKYELNGCGRIEIFWNPNSYLQISGSIMYFAQGHNFTYDHQVFIDAINYIGRVLNVSLWDSVVVGFEYGVIMEVENAPKEYIQHHKPRVGEKLNATIREKDKGFLARWADPFRDLKMYDASRNILNKQSKPKRRILEDAGWNPNSNWLKWEVHYLKPEALNCGKGVILANLVDPDWEDVFKEDLYVQYQRLIPMAELAEPTKKKELSTSDILAMVLVEDSINGSRSVDEVKKMLYNRINLVSNGILSKTDKDSRKKQIRGILKRMRLLKTSRWDLSQQLADVLHGNTDNRNVNLIADEGDE